MKSGNSYTIKSQKFDINTEACKEYYEQTYATTLNYFSVFNSNNIYKQTLVAGSLTIEECNFNLASCTAHLAISDVNGFSFSTQQLGRTFCQPQTDNLTGFISCVRVTNSINYYVYCAYLRKYFDYDNNSFRAAFKLVAEVDSSPTAIGCTWKDQTVGVVVLKPKVGNRYFWLKIN